MAACPTNLEMIFSPFFEQTDLHFKPLWQKVSIGDEQLQSSHLVNDGFDGKSCGLNEFETCDAIDFYISDDVTALPLHGGIEFSYLASRTCPDYELMNSDAMLDMAERCLLFPIGDKSIENKGFNDDKVDAKFRADSDDSCFYLAIHQINSLDQMKSLDQDAQARCFTGDLEERKCVNSQLAFNKLSNSSVSSSCPPLLTKEEKRKPITLVLDLDETLVHSSLDHCDDADFTISVFFNMKQHSIYVKQRPHLHMFLESVSQKFRVVVFTASQSIYAERLLEILDPDRKVFSQFFYRESCIFSDGTYTKDLTILGVDLAKIVIIDNSPQVFRLQVNNGIPIESWFDDPSDQALYSLLPFLETLADVDDVRPLIAERFGDKKQQFCIL